MRSIKNLILVAAVIASTFTTQVMAEEQPVTKDLKLFGLTDIAKPAPYRMLTITVGNYQMELCGIPATDTEPIRLVRKELCTK